MQQCVSATETRLFPPSYVLLMCEDTFPIFLFFFAKTLYLPFGLSLIFKIISTDTKITWLHFVWSLLKIHINHNFTPVLKILILIRIFIRFLK